MAISSPRGSYDGRVVWTQAAVQQPPTRADDALIDLRVLFRLLRPEKLACALEPMLLSVGNELALDFAREGDSFVARIASSVIGSKHFNDTLVAEGRLLVVDMVNHVQSNANQVFSLRHLIVSTLKAEVEGFLRLIEPSGRSSGSWLGAQRGTSSIVRFGVLLGGTMGVAQLAYAYSRTWWRFALGCVLTSMTGLFVLKLTSPKAVWDELLYGARHADFWELVEQRLAAFMQERSYLRAVIGVHDWDWLQAQLQAVTPTALGKNVPLTYGVTREVLRFRPLAGAMTQIFQSIVRRTVLGKTRASA
ncbi:hypothetical protein AB1Y20_013100 [Prymnesium parvum]|uniref:Autophagy-related protein 9 n=1 Tax=Prymnesium parvum TaxID=97485 RepID=A0AB34IN91_PRYPA